MIWYVDIEHPKALADPARAEMFDRVRRERTEVCAATSGLPAEAVFYRDISLARARQAGVTAMAISGNTADWEEYDFRTFEPIAEIINSGEIPTIGFCGGHQLLALLAGAECGPIRRLKPGEQDQGGFAEGWFKEKGFLPVRVSGSDPLFKGLGEFPVFFESHYWEVKEIPDAYELIASTPDVKVQVIRHKTHLVYGTQFHPEASNAEFPDGFTLLRNFFGLAASPKS